MLWFYRDCGFVKCAKEWMWNDGVNYYISKKKTKKIIADFNYDGYALKANIT